MSHYVNILIASDLTLETLRLIERARSISTKSTKISLVHAVPPVSFTYGGISAYVPDMIDYEEVQNNIMDAKKEHVKEMIEYHKLHDVDWDIEVGKPSIVVKNYATENLCDLILMGSHGEKGLKALLGSTTRAVLHDAPCDVLCVRLFDQEK
ncbi:MAG: universal stress protein [Gammaproteobacteria bacterium]|nr:universal stress protein [Gammaproteobacteria bacterium]NNC98185.1 universal stress protein [Gammaproteobacteria bacterium]NNM14867.1 universal stress protein [Gammaproteobacteria bacterium]